MPSKTLESSNFMLWPIAVRVFTREKSSSHFNIVVYNITKQAFLEKYSLQSAPLEFCLWGRPLSPQKSCCYKVSTLWKQRILIMGSKYMIHWYKIISCLSKNLFHIFPAERWLTFVVWKKSLAHCLNLFLMECLQLTKNKSIYFEFVKSLNKSQYK